MLFRQLWLPEQLQMGKIFITGINCEIHQQHQKDDLQLFKSN